jgi:hypothetical protein
VDCRARRGGCCAYTFAPHDVCKVLREDLGRPPVSFDEKLLRVLFVASLILSIYLLENCVHFLGLLKILLFAEHFGAGDEDRTRNFQLGKLPLPPFRFNNLQNCSAKTSLLFLQTLPLFPALLSLVVHWWYTTKLSFIHAVSAKASLRRDSRKRAVGERILSSGFRRKRFASRSDTWR